MNKNSYNDDDNETQNTNEEMRLGKKFFVLLFTLFVIGFFFRPQIVLVNIQNWTMILSNVYTMLFDLCLGFAVSLFFQNKLKRFTTILGLALSLFFGCFLELQFEQDFVEKNSYAEVSANRVALRESAVSLARKNYISIFTAQVFYLGVWAAPHISRIKCARRERERIATHFRALYQPILQNFANPFPIKAAYFNHPYMLAFIFYKKTGLSPLRAGFFVAKNFLRKLKKVCCNA